MKKFLSLPQEKQDRIVKAAMTLFGDVGYKKAYISEIAAAAGISKALIFHYFASKKGLYAYLVYYTGKIVMTEAQHERDTAGKDFFDRALTTVRFRLTLKNRYPAMNAFIESVYKEDDEEVADDIKRLRAIATDMHAGISFAPGEEKALKNGARAADAVDLISTYADGLVASLGGDVTFEQACVRAEGCIGLLRMLLV